MNANVYAQFANLGFIFETIYTPGHTDDSISIYFRDEKILFSGDFVFFHMIGRTDLPTGNYNKMVKKRIG